MKRKRTVVDAGNPNLELADRRRDGGGGIGRSMRTHGPSGTDTAEVMRPASSVAFATELAGETDPDGSSHWWRRQNPGKSEHFIPEGAVPATFEID